MQALKTIISITHHSMTPTSIPTDSIVCFIHRFVNEAYASIEIYITPCYDKNKYPRVNAYSTLVQYKWYQNRMRPRSPNGYTETETIDRVSGRQAEMATTTRTDEMFICDTPMPARASFWSALRLGSFWSFLFTLSGIFDIAIGLLVWTGTITVKNSPVPILEICFIVGALYLAAGLVFTVLKSKTDLSRRP